MLQTTIDQEKVAEVVRFLLYDPALPPQAGICEMDAAAYRLHPSVDEYCEALATIVHLAREMIRMEQIDAEPSHTTKLLDRFLKSIPRAEVHEVRSNPSPAPSVW
jgi:hypothetical protein